MTHKYQVGQALELIGNIRASTRRSGSCKVVALLPFEGQTVQYRIQSDAETHQRIVSENDLRLPGPVSV
ncbi:MAG: hypothetical protein P0Y65_14050 [Candidatus Devosia phytovorans]|uniref:Cold-shock protein n=1 Tax=Candidatus Devosia phytovorans TaxID=3121372 RepID=A0AAJ5VSH7_9HYPH|nr:hypothetical protein [Devosia sp.]WEK03310.1 MAG: hypothetical protein P0Y65_14050 [Devosia sp.]